MQDLRVSPSVLHLAIFVAVLTSASALGASSVIVDGTNDQNIDRQAIQDAIDQAGEGDTVLLRGTFQLDGERIFLRKQLRLRGEAIDDDGDGVANEDWADGVDNDGDGAVDEDDWNTVIHGLVDANGQPLGDLPDGTFFNRGISLDGLSGRVEDVEIRDIAFFGHHRAVSALPDLRDDGDAFLCDDISITGGVLAEARFRRNRFANNGRAVQFFGAVEDSEIKDNVVAGFGVQLLLVGEEAGCIGDTGPLAIGLPTDTQVKGNRVEAFGNAGFISVETVDTRVSGNTFIGGNFAVSVNDDVGADIVDNTMSGSGFPIIVFGSVGDARIAGNQISDHFIGIFLDASSGYDIKENVFQTPGLLADVFLEVTTSDNKVVVPAGTNVIDLGVGNTVMFE